jgi:lipoprotein-anchoring transpeptidase ErfK/SrfK
MLFRTHHILRHPSVGREFALPASGGFTMHRKLHAILFIVLLSACSKEQTVRTSTSAVQAAKGIGQRVKDTFETTVPFEKGPTREEIERQRFNASWLRLKSFQEAARQKAVAQQAAADQQAAVTATFVNAPKFSETLKGLDPATMDKLPIQVPVKGDVSGPSILRAQVLLDRVNFRPGIIDGRWGKNSEIAVYWFQRQNNLPPTGDLDEASYRTLLMRGGSAPAIVRYTVTADDVKGPFVKIPEDVYEKEKLDCLCYESISEELGERFHATADLMAQLNPGIDLDSVGEGTQINALNVPPPLTADQPSAISKIVVSVAGNYLHALDGNGTILFHAPTTVGNKYDPSPDETLKIVKVAHMPRFHYQPTLFHEVPDSDPEAHLQPGPNSPVGLVWMALSKEHFGIHGTTDPDTIGYASSHGCVRLANWDARDLSYQVREQTPVAFVDTKREE